MATVDVRCDGGPADGWACTVVIRDGDAVTSAHRVRVGTEDLDRLAPDATDPTGLVEASFGFLLEREPPGAILRSFELMEIARYFPGYEDEIRRRGHP